MAGRMFDLQGKTALITGAGRGIGRSIALGLAEAGADVALVSRTKSDLDQVTKTISGFGRKTLGIPTDVKNADEIRNAYKQFDEAFGQLDILIASAGISQRVPFLDVSEDNYDEVFDTNVRGLVFCCQEAGRRMISSGGGSIVLISSVVAEMALMNRNLYGATKGAVSALARSLSLEWSSHNVRVNLIAPGFIETSMTKPILDDDDVRQAAIDQTPLRRLGQPDDLVGAAIFLSSDASSFVTGDTIVVDGGLKVS